jgi:hypothetical protein
MCRCRNADGGEISFLAAKEPNSSINDPSGWSSAKLASAGLVQLADAILQELNRLRVVCCEILASVAPEGGFAATVILEEGLVSPRHVGTKFVFRHHLARQCGNCQPIAFGVRVNRHCGPN